MLITAAWKILKRCRYYLTLKVSKIAEENDTKRHNTTYIHGSSRTLKKFSKQILAKQNKGRLMFLTFHEFAAFHAITCNPQIILFFSILRFIIQRQRCRSFYFSFFQGVFFFWGWGVGNCDIPWQRKTRAFVEDNGNHLEVKSCTPLEFLIYS